MKMKTQQRLKGTRDDDDGVPIDDNHFTMKFIFRYDRFKNSVSDNSDAAKGEGIEVIEKSTDDKPEVVANTANGNIDK